ncbi:MAG: site-specific integrase [Nitrosopumilus sp.]|nr:site-specific integrase [Nitrosopumilus sp.]
MKIELADNNEDVYANFLDYMKSPETQRMYIRNLRIFLNLIPNKIFEDYLKEKPRSREIEDLATAFANLAKKDINITKQIIKSYIKETKKEVEAGKISPNTVKNRVKPIKALLSANEIDISWSMINKMFPREIRSDDRAYTKEEIQEMLEHCTDIIDKLIILMFSSSGFRLEAWDYFCWKDVIFFPVEDNNFKGAALRVYRGDPEEYWTFITPETCKILQLYKKEWKSRFLNDPNPDDPLIASTKFDFPHRLRQKGVRARVDKIVTKIGLRDRHKKGQRRFEVKLDHGFRKYFNTMMRRAKVNYLDKEDMMGHKVGLEKNYERYQEDDFERFPEYQKAIPFLTISKEEILKAENDALRDKNSELDFIHKEALVSLSDRVIDLEKRLAEK